MHFQIYSYYSSCEKKDKMLNNRLIVSIFINLFLNEKKSSRCIHLTQFLIGHFFKLIIFGQALITLKWKFVYKFGLNIF